MELILNLFKTIYNYTIGFYFDSIKNAFLGHDWLTLFLLFLPEIIFILIFLFYPTADEEKKMIGESFERKVASWLYPGKPKFHNVIMPLANGGTTEADIVMVNTKGVFCIECKKRGKGLTFYGALMEPIWEIRDLSGRTVGEIQNPVKQNQAHVEALCKQLSTKHIYNILITNTTFDIMWSGIRYANTFNNLLAEGFAMLNMNGIYEFEKELEKMPDVLSQAQVERMSEMLKCLEGSATQRAAHEEYVKNKYND